MICPKCKGKLTVTNTISEAHKIVRRRKCALCGSYFLSEEVLEYGDIQETESGSGETEGEES